MDVGAYGKNPDGGTLASSSFGRALYHNMLDLPPDAALPGGTQPMPYVFVGDEAFPLLRLV